MRTIATILIWGLLLAGAGWCQETADPMQQARALIAADDPKAAIKVLQKHTKKNPTDAQAWVLLGDAQLLRNKPKKALKAFNSALENIPDHQETIYKKAMCHYQLDQYMEAVASYRKVLEKSPKDVQAHFYLGMTLDKMHKMDAAFKQYKILQKLDPQMAQKLYEVLFLL